MIPVLGLPTTHVREKDAFWAPLEAGPALAVWGLTLLIEELCLLTSVSLPFIHKINLFVILLNNFLKVLWALCPTHRVFWITRCQVDLKMYIRNNLSRNANLTGLGIFKLFTILYILIVDIWMISFFHIIQYIDWKLYTWYFPQDGFL